MGEGDMRPRYREPGLIGAIRRFVRRVADLTHAYRALPNMLELADGSVWVRMADGAGAPRFNDCVLPEKAEFMEDEDCREVRSSIALELMDPEVHGFMLFLLKRDEDGDTEVAFRTQTLARWIPTFIGGFARVLDGVEG